MPSLAWAMQDYINREPQRLHTPGHKGIMPHPFTEVAKYDLTELENTGSLFEGGAPFDEVEDLFAKSYGDGAAILSAGGSTLAVQGMIATFCDPGRTLIMVRGCHGAAISACALLGINPHWVAPGPEGELAAIKEALEARPDAAAVYITSPDYFGYLSPISDIAELCGERGIPLLVDCAQGAHLTFFGQHPVALGAAACATSPHKTMPVLTGGALLHLRDPALKERARSRMALFGSTSPSYLILLSLDMLSGRLSEVMHDYHALGDYIVRLRHRLEEKGIDYARSPLDPIRITFDFTGTDLDGEELSGLFHQARVTPELVWDRRAVLLPAPNTDFLPVEWLINALPKATRPKEPQGQALYLPVPAVPLRAALLGRSVTLPLSESYGRVCACVRTVCPPGVPVVVPGEIMDDTIINLLRTTGFDTIDVLE